MPAQTVLPGLAEILTAGATMEFTVIVIVLEVAVLGVAQLSEDVITQDIISPFARDAFE